MFSAICLSSISLQKVANTSYRDWSGLRRGYRSDSGFRYFGNATCEHITKPLNSLPSVAGRSFLAPFMAGVKGLAVVFLGMVFGAGFGAWPPQKHTPWSGIGVGRSFGAKVAGPSGITSDKPAHSVLWFLALWVKLVQGIRSRHSVLSANTKQRVNGP